MVEEEHKTPVLKYRETRIGIMAAVVFVGFIYINNHDLMSTAHSVDATVGDLLLMVIYMPMNFLTAIVFTGIRSVTGVRAFGQTFLWLYGAVFSYLIARYLYYKSNKEIRILTSRSS